MKIQNILFLISLTIISYLAFFSGKQSETLLSQSEQEKLGSQGPSIELIQNLFERLKNKQYDGSEDQFGLEFQKGLYESRIKLNIITPKWTQVWFGEVASLPDNNMFVTSFVVQVLIQIKNFGSISFNEEYLEPAIDALLTFRDKNTPEKIPQYTFWSQVEEDGVWVCSPRNLFAAQDFLANAPKIVQYLAKKIFGISAEFFNLFTWAFKIPADNDDSGMNLALGSLLQENSQQYPNLNKKWQQENSRVVDLYDNVKKFIYKPYSDDWTRNSIDARTFYYAQGFFNKTEDDAKAKGVKPELSLLTTWLQKIDEQIPHKVVMPLFVNNLDMTVNVNGLYGLANVLLTTEDIDVIEQIYDDEIKKLIVDITDFIVWGIESEIILERPDLALTYYPSIYDFYQFVGRTTKFLQGFQNIVFKELEYSKQQLQKVSKIMASQIMSQKKEENGNIFWESLTNYGSTDNKEEIKRREERAFSTTMALNALIDTYTQNAGNNKLQYTDDIPQDVKDTIENSINYLSVIMADEKTPLGNSFFSGSVKVDEDSPYYYPSNGSYLYNWSNGKKIPINPSTPIDKQGGEEEELEILKDDLGPFPFLKGKAYFYTVEGKIPVEEYTDMLYNYKWFGMETPREFNGYDQMWSFGPYWTSDAITLSHAMLAFSKYINIVE